MEFAGKVVLITGAGSGIGAESSRKFAELGADLVLVDRNSASLEKIKDTCIVYKKNVLTILADVTVESDVENIIRETIENFNKIDVLVNSAGIATKSSLLDGLEPYDKAMSVNVRAIYHLTSLAAPHLIKSKGNVVNVSSVCSMNPSPGTLPYRMSKACLDMFTKCVALELAPHVRVNAVNPGFTKTNLLAGLGLNETQVKQLTEGSARMLPLQRVSDADEIADMIVYLAGHKARGITGSVVVIDNGHLAQGSTLASLWKSTS